MRAAANATRAPDKAPGAGASPQASQAQPAADTMRAYGARSTGVDELADERGEIRAAWRAFAARYDALPAGELARRWSE